MHKRSSVTLDRLVKDCQAYIAYQVRSAEEAKKKASKYLPKPFITLSRQAGAGGITIGEELVKFLKKTDQDQNCPWTVFERDLVNKVLEEHHLSAKIKKYMPEDRVSAIREIVEELAGNHPSDLALVRNTNETILHLAQMGHAVIVGRGANIVTHKLLFGVHVRLVAPLEQRLKHIGEYYKLDRKQAAQLIKKEDQGRKKYLASHFGANIDDSLLYDLVVNTSHANYQEVAEMIGRYVLARHATLLKNSQ